MDKRKILKWEILGFFVITLIGTAFHFCFEWSGNFKPLALFCAVNESVWEHLKIGFWPAVFYAIAEYFAFGKNNKNFITAKTLAFYVIPIVITVVFYILEAAMDHHPLWMDIALFNLAILLSQIVSYKVLTSSKDYSKYNRISYILLLIIVAAFSLLTYFPPKLGLFMESRTGIYGIPK